MFVFHMQVGYVDIQDPHDAFLCVSGPREPGVFGAAVPWKLLTISQIEETPPPPPPRSWQLYATK